MNSFIPFEIHLTTNDIGENQKSSFEKSCVEKGGKPLLIELAQGEHCKQPMMSLVIHRNHLDEAILSANDFAKQFNAEGFFVQRIKIEIPAEFEKQVEKIKSETFLPYFEWHGKVEFENVPELLSICLKHRAHLSKNALAKNNSLRFVTLREYENSEIFQSRVVNLVNELNLAGWKINKQFEYCVYDNFIGLDQGWLPQ
jgi:hypothetical protein